MVNANAWIGNRLPAKQPGRRVSPSDRAGSPALRRVRATTAQAYGGERAAGFANPHTYWQEFSWTLTRTGGAASA